MTPGGALKLEPAEGAVGASRGCPGEAGVPSTHPAPSLPPRAVSCPLAGPRPERRSLGLGNRDWPGLVQDSLGSRSPRGGERGVPQHGAVDRSYVSTRRKDKLGTLRLPSGQDLTPTPDP